MSRFARWFACCSLAVSVISPPQAYAEVKAPASKAASAPAAPGVAATDPVADARSVVACGNARFTVLTPALVRMEWSKDGKFEDRASFAFVNRRLPVPEFETKRTSGALTLRTSDLTLRFKDDGTSFNANNLSVEHTGKPAFQWKPGDTDTGNLRGTARTLDNVSGACPLEPGILSRDGWAVVDDSGSIVLAPGDWPWAARRVAGAAQDWYFFGHGRDYRRALGDFVAVSGRPPMPPRYALGGWWSRYWSYTDKELESLIGEFRDHGVPLDVLVVDMGWHLDGWTGYTWAKKYFPDPEGFLKWAHGEALRVTLNLHPADGAGKHEAAFPDMARAMGLDPKKTDRVPFDCTDRRFVEAYFKYLHHPLERMGVDFWWIDWQQGTKTKMPGLDPLPWLNYLHWTDMERNPDRVVKAEGTSSTITSTGTNKSATGPGGEQSAIRNPQSAISCLRPLILSRYGGLGSHRYPLGFSGDAYSNWGSLAFQIYFTATAGNAGYGLWSHDIGGHQPGPVDPELYARWIQWGALSPILRTHGTQNPLAERRIWAFPKDVYEAAKAAWLLRYRLTPYLYTAWREYHDTGVPPCRPLYYDWPGEDEAYRRPGEFMLGPDILAAPIAEPADPVTSCALSRLWLPPGGWVNWYSGEEVRGPREIARMAPLEEIPLWVRAGAIIPMFPVSHEVARDHIEAIRSTIDQCSEPLVLHVFPGEKGATWLYEDDSSTTGYLAGQFSRTPVSFRSNPDGTRGVLEIGPSQGQYPAMSESRRVGIEFVFGKLNRLEASGSSAKVTQPSKALEPLRAGAPSGQGNVEPRMAEWSFPAAKGLVVTASLDPNIGQQGEPVQIAYLKAQEWGAAGLAREQGTAIGRQSAPARSQPSDVTGEGGARKGASGLADSLGRHPLRLLGVLPRLRVEAESGARLTIAAEAWLTKPFRNLEARLQVKPLGAGWTPAGGESKWKKLEQDRAAVVETVFKREGPAVPNTVRVKADFILRTKDLTLTVPLERTLFPSVNAWHVCGPFDNPEGIRLGRVFPPEKGIDLKATYPGKDGGKAGWRKVVRPTGPGTDPSGDFVVNLNEAFGRQHDNAMAYAVTHLFAPSDTTATLALGSDDGVVAWLNGSEVWRHEIGRPCTARQDRVPITLRAGDNTLLLKISQGGAGWAFSACVVDAAGNVMPDVEARLE